MDGDFKLDGLTDFQKDLLTMAQNKLPKESVKIMRKIGNKAKANVAKKARSEVGKVTGNYHKRWKRGKVFKGNDGEWVVRVINSSPHAHLIENGHRQVTKNGQEKGFIQGKKVLEKSMSEFDDSGQFGKILGDWLDDLLESGKL